MYDKSTLWGFLLLLLLLLFCFDLQGMCVGLLYWAWLSKHISHSNILTGLKISNRHTNTDFWGTHSCFCDQSKSQSFRIQQNHLVDCYRGSYFQIKLTCHECGGGRLPLSPLAGACFVTNPESSRISAVMYPVLCYPQPPSPSSGMSVRELGWHVCRPQCPKYIIKLPDSGGLWC